MPLVDVQRLSSESFARFVEYFDVLPSTNDLAMRLSPDPRTDTPRLLIAGEQTAGRGRGANQWWSASGALTFSLIIDVDDYQIRSQHWPCVAVTAALSVCEVLETIAPASARGVKWPNDVWLAGRKVSGILIEIPRCRPPVPARLVVGVGLNVNNSFATAPDAIRAVGTAVCDVIGTQSDLTTVLLMFLSRLQANLIDLGAGDPGLPERWQRLCVLRDRTVSVAAAESVVTGTCRGIAADGSLTLENDAGIQQVYGGVVQSIR